MGSNMNIVIVRKPNNETKSLISDQFPNDWKLVFVSSRELETSEKTSPDWPVPLKWTCWGIIIVNLKRFKFFAENIKRVSRGKKPKNALNQLDVTDMR